MEALRAGLTMLLSIVVPLALQLYDRQRLPPLLQQRTWGYATWAGALYAFGPLSMLGWIFVTRRPGRRVLVAIPYTMAPLVILLAADLAFSLATSAPLETSALDVLLFLVIAPIAIGIIMLLIEAIVHLWRLATRQPLPGAQWRALGALEDA